MNKGEAQSPPPNVLFAFPELLAMTTVIAGYIAYIQSLPPFPERERRITILAAMRAHFQEKFIVGHPEIQVPLHAEEVAELLEALFGFVKQIKQILPENDERDQVVRTVDSWRLRLACVIAEYNVE